MIETGKILQQRYRIDKQIGQGGMGAVYIATDERFGSTVAIKETLFMDDNYRKAIEREARLLNSLKHAALPRVSDHFLEENVQFLVMEYIPGEDLSHMLESGATFEPDQVLKWADQLLDALEYLHTQSVPVIHRDIKPQNLKLTSRDQIILLDFGLAKGNPTDAGHQTAAKSIFGYSRNYASLEQIQGTGTDPRSDLYSLAATLYHLLTGTPPEDALTRAMAVLSNRPDPLQPASSVRAAVPRGVAGVLQRSLALSADDRPTTAAEMRDMLRRNEEFGYLADPVTFVERPTADVFAQQTKLMPSDTKHEVAGQTDVKTAVMSGYVSEETSLRSPAQTGGGVNPASHNRRGLKISAALGAILLACGTAAGLYFYDPAIFGERSAPMAVEAEKVPQPTVGTDVPTTKELSSETVEPTLTANSNTAELTRQSTSKPETTKSKTATKEETNIDPQADVSINGDTIYIGNVKVGPEGITPNVWIDKNGVRHPVPPPANSMPFPGLTREQFEQMTPRQRQKLIEARRRLLMLQRQRPRPVPSVSPELPR